MDEDLEALLANPFVEVTEDKSALGIKGEQGTQVELARSLLEHSQDITSRAVHDYSHFRQGIDLVLRPHVSSVELIESKLFSQIASTSVRSQTDPYYNKFRQNAQEIKRCYRTYIETAVDEVLEREANRLGRRYFQDEVTDEKRDFIKFKRFYEKVKTFNELIKTHWREIQKIMDTFSVMLETRSIVTDIENEYLKSVHLLVRQTDSFLDAFKLHMNVEEENLDHITGGYRILVTFSPTIRYNMPGFYGDPPPRREAPVEIEEIIPEPEEEDPFASIAKNIVIESREHRLNRASIFATRLLGSRDWNRTPHYNLEVPVAYYKECLESFQKAYHINMDPNDIRGPMAAAAAVVRSGVGEQLLESYVRMLYENLEKLSDQIINEDFPGLENPLVFLYHCGPEAINHILHSSFNRQKIGEMFYLDSTGSTISEIPDELIKKELIDWWNVKMSALSGEEVDSYLTYSRGLEMVKKDYRALYEEGSERYRREVPGGAYFGLDKWLHQNRSRIFGVRKIEIFRRFLKKF